MSSVTLDPALDAVLAAMAGSTGTVSVLDLGGGSGRNAVPLAQAGAGVTVVDRSADALATLARRADEAGVADRVVGVQADVEAVAAGLIDVADVPGFALVLCHDVLDAVDDPPAVLAALAARARALSVVVANPQAAVIGRALAGQPRAALELLDARSTAAVASGTPDIDAIEAVCHAAGLRATVRRGLGLFAGKVSGDLLDASPHARTELLQLDRRLADDPSYRALAVRLQVFATRAEPATGHGN